MQRLIVLLSVLALAPIAAATAGGAGQAREHRRAESRHGPAAVA
jgi:hypothetical protein